MIPLVLKTKQNKTNQTLLVYGVKSQNGDYTWGKGCLEEGRGCYEWYVS